MLKSYLCCLTVCLSFILCKSSRILVVFPMPGKSHGILGRSCVDLLLGSGHQVTYITWDQDLSEWHQNLTLIDISLPLPIEDRYNLRKSMNEEVDLGNMFEFVTMVSVLERKILEHVNVQKLLSDPKENFDVAILEWLYGEYVAGIPAVLGCPYIWLSSMEPHFFILSLIGETPNPAYVPINVFKSTPPYTFMQRVLSLWDLIKLQRIELKTIMDNSKHGVVYFSMGSTLKSKDFPDKIKEQILKVFGGLKQTVVWKFERILPHNASNVHITSWSPQQSILAHPNCVLFITHGGQLSALEALHFGFPLIGIPVFADQYLNIKTLVSKGMTKEVSLSDNLAEDLKVSIEEVLRNTSFAQAAKRESFIYHHRAVPPEVELVHWVEHVIRTSGAPHLRSITLITPWYQRCYLDVAAVAKVILILLIQLVKWLFTKMNSVYNMKRDNVKKMQ